METVIDWSKAPEGTEAAHPGSEQIFPGWFRRDAAGLVEQICPGAGINNWSWMGGRRDFPYGHVLRTKPWTGGGLPPVGTMCEFNVGKGDWVECEVVAHHAGFAVCWSNLNGFAANGTAIRPIRTPEQIAAEEREEAISEMVKIAKDQGPQSNQYQDMGAIYDAGYRKQAPE